VLVTRRLFERVRASLPDDLTSYSRWPEGVSTDRGRLDYKQHESYAIDFKNIRVLSSNRTAFFDESPGASSIWNGRAV
jgi:hypothetical protein